MARRRRKARGLGFSPAGHAKAAEAQATTADIHLKSALRGSCSMRFTSLLAAERAVAKAVAHAFRSGGRTAAGALTPKTVSTETALRIHKLEDAVEAAASSFRSKCVLSSTPLDGTRRRKR